MFVEIFVIIMSHVDSKL